MDPAATIASAIDGSMSHREALDALQSWYSRRGFRPTLAQVDAILTRRGEPRPRNWKASARSLGATD